MAVEQLAPLITNVLSANKEERDAAQAQIDAIKSHPDFSPSLLSILLRQDVPLSARQMAGVLLKQFIENNWSECPHTQAKDVVKANILPGLGDSISKVRSCVAAAMSEIAVLDFPENWPGLFDNLIQMLSSNDANKIHGVMKVLDELANDITDNQVYVIAPVLFPQLVSLFKSPNFDAVTRSRAISIFSVMVDLIAHMDSVDDSANEKLLFPILPDLITECLRLISCPVTTKEDYKLLSECVVFFTKLVNVFPKQMGDKVSTSLPTLWNLLNTNAGTYVSEVANNPDYTEDDGCDSDGSSSNLGTLVQAIFDFIKGLTERKKYKAMIRKVLPDVVCLVISYLTLPEYQIEIWDADAEKYVEDDDEDSMNYSVRTSAMELLIDLGAELKTSYVEALIQAITKIISSCGNINEGYNWKVYEACATALNISGDTLEDCLEAKKVEFSFSGFYNSVVLQGLATDKPYLQGRLIWLASSYVKDLPSEQAAQQLLECICKSLTPAANHPVVIGAMKGICALLAELESDEERQILLKPMEQIIPALFDLASNLEGDFLILCLDALRVTVSVRPDIVASEADKVNRFLVDLFVKYASDSFILASVNEVLVTVADIPQCQDSIQNTVVPALVQILQTPINTSPKKKGDDDLDDMRSDVLELLTTIIRKTPLPLPEAYISGVYNTVLNLTLSSSKSSTAILQTGSECVTAFISQAYPQVSAFNINGVSSTTYILNLISKLLDPEVEEYGALYSGKLVSAMINQAGSSLNINEILQAVLNKLVKCETPTVQQSLLVVFIKLFNHDLEASMNFLQGLTTATGENALAYVLKHWCEIQVLFNGEFETKLAIIAFTKILPHLLNSNSPLSNIMVNDDEIHLDSGRITRSNKEQQGPVQVPLTLKIFKILVQEFGVIIEEKQAEADVDSDEEGDDEEEEFEEQTITLAQLAAMLGDDDQDDEDNKKHPLYDVDTFSHLQEFLTQLSGHSSYPNLCGALSDSEKKILGSMQVMGS